MKKLLSAVLAVTMIVITATFTKPVFAAGYTYTPADGKQVVYLSNTADTANKVYNNIGDAVNALGSNGGYVVLLENVNIGTTNLPAHTADIITIRGRDDGSKVTFTMKGYRKVLGDYAFENLNLAWEKNGSEESTMHFVGHKIVFGKAGVANDVVLPSTSEPYYTGGDIVINSGTVKRLRLSEYGNVYNYEEVNIVVNGGTLERFIIGWDTSTTRTSGAIVEKDFNITVNGGTLGHAGVLEFRSKNCKLEVGGELRLTVNGGSVPNNFKLVCTDHQTPDTLTVGEGYVADLRNAPANLSKLDQSQWDIILGAPVYVSDDGSDDNNGTVNAPVKTLAKALSLAGGDATVVVKDIFTLDNVTETSRSTKLAITGADEGSLLIVNGDYTMGGATTFDQINIVNDTNGAIVAAGNKLVITNNVVTAENQDGAYIDVVGGKRGELSTINVSIFGGTYNNVSTVGLAGSKSNISDNVEIVGFGSAGDVVLDSQIIANLVSNRSNIEIEQVLMNFGYTAKYAPTADADVYVEYPIYIDNTLKELSGEFQPYVKVEYYMYARESDTFTEVYPMLQIGDKTYEADQPLVANQWAIATFEVVDAGRFSFVTFYPYGDCADEFEEWNKMYVPSVSLSQTQNNEIPTYSALNLGEDGEIAPYAFNPASEGLEVLPVVYYAEGGAYTGDATGSINSNYAYGDLNTAIKELDKIGGGYVILTSEALINCAKLGSNGSLGENICGFPSINAENAKNAVASHSNMIILRGMDEDENNGEKVKLLVGGMPHIGGPLWLQNLNVTSVSKGDTGLAAAGNDLRYGTPNGADDDVVVSKYSAECTNVMLVGGADGGTYDQINITIYSGTPYKVKMTGLYGGTTVEGNVNINIYGGNLYNTSIENGNSRANKDKYSLVKGDFNINITGGRLSRHGLPITTTSGNYSRIEGNVNVKISGNPIFRVPDQNGNNGMGNITCPALVEEPLGFAGETRTIDLLGYTGTDLDYVKSKIKKEDFDVLNINVVYLKDGGTGNGSSKDNAVGSLEDAVAACSAGSTESQIYGGKIVICGDGYTVAGDVAEAESSRANTIIYTSVDGASLKFNEGNLVLSGETIFKDITLKMTNSAESYIVANGNKLTIGENVQSSASGSKYVGIVGGTLEGTVSSANVEINSGKFQNVITGDSVEGDVNVVINAGTIYGDIVGGTNVENGTIDGNVKIQINGGTINGKVVGGSTAAGVIEGGITIDITNGTFGSNSEIIIANENDDAVVTNNAMATITNGDFSSMADNKIVAGYTGDGSSANVGVTYKNYAGSSQNSPADKIFAEDENFDSVTVPNLPKPEFTSKDRFVFIIEHYGDPARALEKTEAFKVIQSAPQSGEPIVVTPRQLFLSMDGADHAIMSIQDVKDTTETIRFVPNHNPTKGSAIITDGYNIRGRGVDTSIYKYVEVVYYYTVPEGEKQAATRMALRPLQDHVFSPVSSGILVPNKWTTTIIDMTDAFYMQTGDLVQYHFYPMGANKKGTDIPTTQYIDIASLTFYTEKPETTVRGGKAPTLKMTNDDASSVVTPIDVPDLNINIGLLDSPVDDNGAFVADMVEKDGMTVMEYTPDIWGTDAVKIEGYNCMGKVISLNEYRYATMKIFVESDRSYLQLVPNITNLNSGVTNNDEKAQVKTYKADKVLPLNEWVTVTIKIAPENPMFHLTRQFHICPVGSVPANTFYDGEKIYLAEFVLSYDPPAIETEVEEGEEVETEFIDESPEVVVDGTKLINSTGNFATFKSSVEVFDGRDVVAIKPTGVSAPVSVDGSAIFGDSEQTPGGALSLKTHRYAVITYYYATEDADSEVIPEFELLGGRIQNRGSVTNGVIAKGTSGLKKNKWSTAVVKLSGNGEGELTSGFTLRPFGNTAAANVAGDVLYIQKITFVSNRP